MTTHSLGAIFDARSVAVVGASRDPNKAAHQILKSLLEEGFTGKVFPVNPRETEILGQRCYSSVLEIPEPVDLIVVGVPAVHVPGVMREAAQRGDVRGAVIISAGFAETGRPEGIALQQEVVAIARQAGIRVIGPNCIGVMNTRNRLTTSFSPGVKLAPGSIGFFTQSGAAGGSLLLLAGEQPVPLGFSKFAHVGNMSDVTNLEVLEYYETDPTVKVIVGYMEGVRDGRRLMALADRITRKKPILLLKVGRTAVGAQATLSHTGALAGSDDVYDAAFAQCGILRVNTMEELVDAAKALTLCPLPRGNRIAILTEAGGPGIIAMDEVGSDPAVTLAPMTPETQEALTRILPPMASVCKPNGYVDLTAAAMAREHGEALRLALADPNVDAAILISLPPTFLPAEQVAEAVAAAAAGHRKPVVACFMTGECMAPARRYLEERGIPTFETPDRAARALINLIKAAARLQTAPEPAEEVAAAGEQRVAVAAPAGDRPGPAPAPPGPEAEEPAPVHPAIAAAATAGRHLLEPEAIGLLADYGVPTLPARWVRTPEEALAAADELGYPVVLKVVSPQILHKSDVGGVKLNLRDRDAVARAYHDLMARVRSAAPAAEIAGVLVTPFVTGGTETIVGLVRDPQFGPVVMFGLGGIYAEVFRDVRFRVAPFSREEALRMIGETRVSALLRGFRGSPPLDVEALADLLVAVGEIGLRNPPIAEMDLNPVRVLERGLAVLDARVVLRPARDTRHLDGGH
ncbi:MAG: acetate--CoA ligase family protein [Firmicutes bacterium]|nr:acetate--CoA ligase family protein [Bacillota bacterium]